MKKQKREFWCYEFPVYGVELCLKNTFSDNNCKITAMHVFKYLMFLYIVALCYYQFNILLYVCKYFLKFPFWVVNSDLSFVTHETEDKCTCSQSSVFPGCLSLLSQSYIHLYMLLKTS